MLYEEEQIQKLEQQLAAFKKRPDYDRVCRWYQRRSSCIYRQSSEDAKVRKEGRPLRVTLMLAGLTILLALAVPKSQTLQVSLIIAMCACFVAYDILHSRNTAKLPHHDDPDAHTSEALGYTLTPDQERWYADMQNVKSQLSQARSDLIDRKETLEKARQHEEQMERLEELRAQIEANKTPQERNRENPTICPCCGSSNTTVISDRNKLSVGGAVVGGIAGSALGGPAGAALGAGVGSVGKHVTKMVCRDCGKRWEFKS